MCAKKTPTTPTKQQSALTGVTKTSVKKASAPKQTTKAKADDSVAKSNSSSAIIRNVDSRKSDAKLPSTSNKKATKTIVNETTKAGNPTTPVKGNSKQSQAVKDTKKTISRDSSTDNVKGKKQAVNGKAIKVKSADNDRNKLGEDKSNHVRDNKITDKSGDEVKSKSNSTNEQCNKFEKSSSSLSLKSGVEIDNVIKEKEKLSKKVGSSKASPASTPSTTPKKINNRSSDDGNKKTADKSKPSKIVKKVNKEKESKIKIPNELKNLGIDMSKSNSSLAVVIQEGLMSSGVKTSICEMVKTKARYCSNLNSVGKSLTVQAKKPTEGKTSQINKTNKESQEKVLKEVEAKVNESVVEDKKVTSDQPKLIETPSKVVDDKKVVQDSSTGIKSVVDAKTAGRNKISAMVNAKNSNKIKSSNETKKCENVNKSNETESTSKPVKRKYVKKKKPEDAADVSKISCAAVSESDARNNDKIDQNKSNCSNISDGKIGENKSTTKPDTQLESTKVESAAVGKMDKFEAPSCESTAKTAQNKAKTLAKAKNQLKEDSKVKKAVQSMSSDDKSVSASGSSEAAKIKRKYVRKAKTDINEKAKESENPEEFEKPKEVENPNPIKVESDKLFDNKEVKKPVVEVPPKNGLTPEKKAKVVLAKDDLKKLPEKLSLPSTPKKDLLKVDDKLAKTKTLKCKNLEKLSNEKVSKQSSKKQKVEIKQEQDPLASSSSESENSSDSDSERDDSETTFKKPMLQRNPHNKKQKVITCKRTRVASLNASAKVHCLFENEARSALEASNIAKAIKKSTDGSSASDEDETEAEEKEVDVASTR